ncbi:MAG: sigma-70 family RNA polymerase sigma factor, partial [Myxococcales bacterium]
ASQLLAPLYREVFTLFTFGKLSQRQIARRLSLSASTVATRLVRARHKLRALLESGRHQDPSQRAEKLTEGTQKSFQALPATPDSPAAHPGEQPGIPTAAVSTLYGRWSLTKTPAPAVSRKGSATAKAA